MKGWDLRGDRSTIGQRLEERGPGAAGGVVWPDARVAEVMAAFLDK